LEGVGYHALKRYAVTTSNSIVLFVGVKTVICNESVLKDAVSLLKVQIFFLLDQIERICCSLDMAGILFFKVSLFH